MTTFIYQIKCFDKASQLPVFPTEVFSNMLQKMLTWELLHHKQKSKNAEIRYLSIPIPFYRKKLQHNPAVVPHVFFFLA